jgi:ABC-type cobalamin/Fe3+-siderophores transport system ATPase subunit
MQIRLPKKNGQANQLTIDTNQLVVIGANGSGKTRFGHNLAKVNPNSLLVSAQKSLVIPPNFVLKSRQQAEQEFFSGSVVQVSKNSYNSRQHQKPIDPLSDYEQLLILLFAEEAAISTKYRKDSLIAAQAQIPKTQLDFVKEIWESIITHRTLNLNDLTVNVSGYSGTEMSDGERLIFYIIGQVVCARQNQIIIIDEPENHLHKSVIKKLYNQLENVRPDCLFIYLTHDIDFAFTRESADKIWAKNYLGTDNWDYEILDSNLPIPEQLYLEVLGSRKPVIFLEGDNSSIDYKIYEQVFTDYTIKPLGSCEKVIQSVKAFNEQNGFHNIQSFGIIDKDRRPLTELPKLNSKNIWVLDVAEAENLLLLENIVKSVATYMGKDPNDVFNQVKANLIHYFNEQLETQILLHYKELLRREYLGLTNFNSKNIADVITEIDGIYGAVDKQLIFNNIKAEFENVVATNDYNAVLRLFNLKNALIPHSKICELTDVKNKDGYLRLVLTLLKRNEALGQTIKSEIDDRIIKTAHNIVIAASGA